MHKMATLKKDQKLVFNSNYRLTGFIQTGQNKIPRHFPDFSLTAIRIPDITVLARETWFYSNLWVYSCSEQLCYQFRLITLNFDIKIFNQAFHHVYSK